MSANINNPPGNGNSNYNDNNTTEDLGDDFYVLRGTGFSRSVSLNFEAPRFYDQYSSAPRHFVYQALPVDTDFEFIVRVKNVARTSSNGSRAFAGIYLTQTLSPTDADSLQEADGYVMDDKEAGNKVRDNWPMSVDDADKMWLKMLKIGKFVGVYRSDDGRRWETVSGGVNNFGFGCELDMTQPYNYVGMYVREDRNANSSQLATAQFDNVQLIIGTPYMPYTSSYLGNGGAQGTRGGHLQRRIHGMTVDPHGKVYIPTSHDEQGTGFGYYQDGEVLGRVNKSSTYKPLGVCEVVANNHIMFASSVSLEWTNAADVDAPPCRWEPMRNVRSLVYRSKGAKKLYVVALTDPFDIHTATLYQYDATSLDTYPAAGSTFSLPLVSGNGVVNTINIPGLSRIALDGNGVDLWGIIQKTDTEPARVVRINASTSSNFGTLLTTITKTVTDETGQEIEWLPVDLASDKKLPGYSSRRRLLIADNGLAQQISEYDIVMSPPVLSREIGVKYGIYGDADGAGSADVTGRPGTLKFNGLTHVKTDANGDIYVGCNSIMGLMRTGPMAGDGTSLQKFDNSSVSEIWGLNQHFDMGSVCVDPGDDSLFYGVTKKFSVDWNLPVDYATGAGIGEEADYAGIVRDPFLYPNLDYDVILTEFTARGNAAIRYINGVKYLFSFGFPRVTTVYRLDGGPHGEVGVPVVSLMSTAASDLTALGENYYASLSVHVDPSKGVNYLWTDGVRQRPGVVNANGVMESGEILDFDSGSGPKQHKIFSVAGNGDLWAAKGKDVEIDKFVVTPQTNGTLDYVKGITITCPEFEKSNGPDSGITDFAYDSANDAMYVVGDTVDVAGLNNKIVRYNNWSSGSPVVAWVRDLPEYRDEATNPSAGGGDVERDPNPTGMEVAGDYVFLGAHAPACVQVYRASDGSEVTYLANNGMMEALRINPGPELSGLFTDLDNGQSGMNAHYVASTGEYVIFTNDDMFGKARLYRWYPPHLNYNLLQDTFEDSEDYTNLARVGATAGSVPPAPAGYDLGSFVGKMNIKASTSSSKPTTTAVSNVSIPLPEGAAGLTVNCLVGLADQEQGNIVFKIVLIFDNGQSLTTQSSAGSAWDNNMIAYHKPLLSIPAGATEVTQIKILFQQKSNSQPAQTGYVDNVTVTSEYQ